MGTIDNGKNLGGTIDKMQKLRGTIDNFLKKITPSVFICSSQIKFRILIDSSQYIFSKYKPCRIFKNSQLKLFEV